MRSLAHIISLFVCLCILGGCSNRRQPRSTTIEVSHTVPVVFDVEKALLHPTDSFVINDIAATIRLIRLRTPADVFINTFRFQAAVFDGGFAISSAGKGNLVDKILLFDGNGQYLKPALIQGHGHGELPRIWKWSVCQDTLYAIGDKNILRYSKDANVSLISKESDMITDVVPLRQRWMVYFPPWTFLPDRVTSLSLKFADRLDGSVHTLQMPVPVISRNKLVDNPGIDKGNMERAILSASYGGDALFKNIYNDTLYRVVSPGDVYPEAVLYTGRFHPRHRYAEDRQKKERTAMIDVVSETSHYIIVRCLYQGERYVLFWDKRTKENVASLPMRYEGSFTEMCFICPVWYRAPGGERLVVNLLYFGEDRIVACLMPEHIPALSPDSIQEDNCHEENPVLLEILLK